MRKLQSRLLLFRQLRKPHLLLWMVFFVILPNNMWNIYVEENYWCWERKTKHSQTLSITSINWLLWSPDTDLVKKQLWNTFRMLRKGKNIYSHVALVVWDWLPDWPVWLKGLSALHPLLVIIHYIKIAYNSDIVNQWFVCMYETIKGLIRTTFSQEKGLIMHPVISISYLDVTFISTSQTAFSPSIFYPLTNIWNFFIFFFVIFVDRHLRTFSSSDLWCAVCRTSIFDMTHERCQIPVSDWTPS